MQWLDGEDGSLVMLQDRVQARMSGSVMDFNGGYFSHTFRCNRMRGNVTMRIASMICEPAGIILRAEVVAAALRVSALCCVFVVICGSLLVWVSPMQRRSLGMRALAVHPIQDIFNRNVVALWNENDSIL